MRARGNGCLHFLKKDGVSFLPYLDDAAELPDARFVNTYLLGVLSAMLPIDGQHWMASIETVVAKKIAENKQVFALGAEKGKKSEP